MYICKMWQPGEKKQEKMRALYCNYKAEEEVALPESVSACQQEKKEHETEEFINEGAPQIYCWNALFCKNKTNWKA